MDCQKHLFQIPDGIHYLNCAYMSPLPPGMDGEALVGELQARNVYVSLRGNNIRISVNVFNTEEDIRQLMAAL